MPGQVHTTLTTTMNIAPSWLSPHRMLVLHSVFIMIKARLWKKKKMVNRNHNHNKAQQQREHKNQHWQRNKCNESRTVTKTTARRRQSDGKARWGMAINDNDIVHWKMLNQANDDGWYEKLEMMIRSRCVT
jgi:hypothetical protein